MKFNWWRNVFEQSFFDWLDMRVSDFLFLMYRQPNYEWRQLYCLTGQGNFYHCSSSVGGVLARKVGGRGFKPWPDSNPDRVWPKT